MMFVPNNSKGKRIFDNPNMNIIFFQVEYVHPMQNSIIGQILDSALFFDFYTFFLQKEI